MSRRQHTLLCLRHNAPYVDMLAELHSCSIKAHWLCFYRLPLLLIHLGLAWGARAVKHRQWLLVLARASIQYPRTIQRK